MASRPLYSVIIVSYNNFHQTTANALESLVDDGKDTELREVIVIDNGSDDFTRSQLNQFSSLSLKLKLILNESNLGFPKAVNMGIKEARGQYLVLLNSDTRVMPGAMLKLVRALEENPDYGAISPVTNSAGNEQHILFPEDDPEKILKSAKNWTRNASPNLLLSQRLDFSCVAISKQTRDRVGLLDEDFSPGYFEDFDYCIRLTNNNLKMGVLETAFVYHEGGASFSEKPKATRELIKANKKKIIKKHSGITFLHRRDCNLDAMKSYHTQLKDSLDLAYPFFKRVNLASTDSPKGWLKKKKYTDRLLSLTKEISDDLILLNKPIQQEIDQVYETLIRKPELSDYNGSQNRGEFLLALLYLEHRIREIERNVVSFLEIGAFKGLWAIALGVLCKKHGKTPLYVTVHNPENEDLTRVCQRMKSDGFLSAKIIDGDSATPSTIKAVHEAHKAYDFVLIDADHSFDAVKKDIENYAHLATEVCLFHDVVTKKCGVGKAIESSGIGLHYVISRGQQMGIGLRDQRLPQPKHSKISKTYWL
jgi:GT2 family glycosyltransferase/predicted O-methyltransferase YrrM